MSTVMTAPNLTTDSYVDIVRRVIDARTAYERLCGVPPTVIHVSGPILAALEKRELMPGAEIAGMRIVERIGSVADMAICSRDAELFTAPVVGKRRK